MAEENKKDLYGIAPADTSIRRSAFFSRNEFAFGVCNHFMRRLQKVIQYHSITNKKYMPMGDETKKEEQKTGQCGVIVPSG